MNKLNTLKYVIAAMMMLLETLQGKNVNPAGVQDTAPVAAQEDVQEETFSLEFVYAPGTDEEEVILTEKDIVLAEAASQGDTAGNSVFIVRVTLGEEGAAAFAEATGAHIGEQIHIIINGETVSAPVVHEAITDGQCVISGNFSFNEAWELAEMLNGLSS